MTDKPLNIVSISIGSSKRDKEYTTQMLGREVNIKRYGTDGSFEKAGELMRGLSAEVDCFGLGGMDLYLWTTTRSYTVKDAAKLVLNAGSTPIVDGSDLKHSYEKKVVRELFEKKLLRKNQHCLMTSGIDRMGMAEALNDGGVEFIFGDLIFALGLQVTVTTFGQINFIGALLLPIITRLPFKWVYPTGEKQDETKPKYGKYYQWADVIAGDFHYIRKYMPISMQGKTILTNTTTEEDVEMLRARGVKYLITTTPRMGGRSFGANVMQAMIVAFSGKRPEKLSREDYIEWAEKLDLKPDIQELNVVTSRKPESNLPSMYPGNFSSDG